MTLQVFVSSLSPDSRLLAAGALAGSTSYRWACWMVPAPGPVLMHLSGIKGMLHSMSHGAIP